MIRDKKLTYIEVFFTILLSFLSWSTLNMPSSIVCVNFLLLRKVCTRDVSVSYFLCMSGFKQLHFFNICNVKLNESILPDKRELC